MFVKFTERLSAGRQYAMPRQFKPSLSVTIATAVFCAVTISAGFWQLDRAAQKRERHLAIESAKEAVRIDLNQEVIGNSAISWQSVRVSGEYLAAETVFIDNRVFLGKPGYHVVTPLRIIDSRRVVLVNRGWLAGSPARDEPRVSTTPTGVVGVEGLLTLATERAFELGTFEPNARVWPNLTLERFAKGRGIAVEPYLVLQTNDAQDGLVRAWEMPASGAEKNQIYAVQWFSFAALAIILYIALNLRRNANPS
jgi:surfeit locus 1 family protein